MHALVHGPKKVPRIVGGEGPKPRQLLLIERQDGTFSFCEDELTKLNAYRPNRGERTRRLRAFVRIS